MGLFDFLRSEKRGDNFLNAVIYSLIFRCCFFKKRFLLINIITILGSTKIGSGLDFDGD
mgnify:CR=1 FL=1